ncbi:hypothetical protein F5B18DRAFT_647495 [Nemania serpens]|nr:hypothetical protein F5B18DRAFT_647495 [Nemania serpens]
MSAQDLQDLHRRMANLLAVPSLHAFARALSVVEEQADRAAAAGDLDDPVLRQILHACRTYHSLCSRTIRELSERATAAEHENYERRRSEDGSASASESENAGGNAGGSGRKRKRGDAVFEVDSGEHIVAALEALRLEEFLEEQGREVYVVKERKKVRFSS